MWFLLSRAYLDGRCGRDELRLTIDRWLTTTSLIKTANCLCCPPVNRWVVCVLGATVSVPLRWLWGRVTGYFYGTWSWGQTACVFSCLKFWDTISSLCVCVCVCRWAPARAADVCSSVVTPCSSLVHVAGTEWCVAGAAGATLIVWLV